jgi:glutamyl endopeptidase
MFKHLSNALVRSLVIGSVLLFATAATAASGLMVRIDAAKASPLSPIVHVVADFADGWQFTGSGTMVDRYHVLTAGHMVYNAAHSPTGWAYRVSVYAGQTGKITPFGVAYSTKIRTFQSFMNDDKVTAESHKPGDGDIGLITLDRPLGDQTGWYGLGYVTNDAFFTGRLMNTAGYPAQQGYDGTQMYWQAGRVIGVVEGTSAPFEAVEWSMDVMTSIPGQSGSGIYDYNQQTDSRVIYAVLDLSNTTDHVGYGEVITRPVFDMLQQWIAEDHLA